MTKRFEFAENIKAEIFVRDKSLCAFSCKSLWLLDYVACPTVQYDWIDHIKPASKSGDNSMENGILTSWFYNSNKGNNSRDTNYLLKKGFPTANYYAVFEVITDELANNIKRFSKLHFYDYYFNRALYNLHLALDFLVEPINCDGKKYRRDYLYYAKSMEKRLSIWSKLVKENNVSSFEKRELINYQSKDVEIILNLRNNPNLEQIVNTIKVLFPYYKANYELIDKLENAQTVENISAIEQKSNDNYISPRVKAIVIQNINKLKEISTFK